MTAAIKTGSKYVQDVKDRFYFSSPEQFGGGVEVGEQVAIIAEQTGNLLALGRVIEKGKPYAECATVQVEKRFD
jgi:hypothetical protein